MAFRLYFDEDPVNRALIRALLARGMDVTNAIDAGRFEVQFRPRTRDIAHERIAVTGNAPGGPTPWGFSERGLAGSE